MIFPRRTKPGCPPGFTGWSDTAYLEDCCQKVINLLRHPARKFPEMPHFREAKKVSSEDQTATKTCC